MHDPCSRCYGWGCPACKRHYIRFTTQRNFSLVPPYVAHE